MATIVDAINATTETITVSGLDVPVRGTNLSIDSEIVTYAGKTQDPLRPYVQQSANRWRVKRGQAGTTAASHSANATIAVKVKEYGPLPIDANAGGASDAASVSYDPTESGLTAEDVKAALDEIAAEGGGPEVIFSETTPDGPFPNGALWVVTDPAEGAEYLQIRVWNPVAEEFQNVGLADALAGSVETWTGFSANGTEGDATIDIGGNPDGLIELHLKDEDGDNDRHYRLLMGGSRIELSYVDPDAASADNSIVLNGIGISLTGLLGLFGASPVAQGAAIADATTDVDVIPRLNELLAYLRSRGDIAT